MNAIGRLLAIAGLVFAVGPARADDVRDDLFLAVAAHEIGHAVIREFDLPITASEEIMADAFAVVLLHEAMPDDVARIVSRRAAAHLGDGGEAGRFDEYPADARRAGADLCLAYALDPDGRAAMAERFGLAGDEARSYRDYGVETARGWRRTIAPLRMPPGARVTEVGLSVDDGLSAAERPSDAALEAARSLMAGFDWHSFVTLSLVQCDGGAEWSRNGRTITICGAYLDRLVVDAERVAP